MKMKKYYVDNSRFGTYKIKRIPSDARTNYCFLCNKVTPEGYICLFNYDLIPCCLECSIEALPIKIKNIKKEIGKVEPLKPLEKLLQTLKRNYEKYKLLNTANSL